MLGLINKIIRRLRLYVWPKPSFIDNRILVDEIKYSRCHHSFAGYYDRSPLYMDNYLFLATNEDDYILGGEAEVCLYNRISDEYRKLATVRAWNFQQAAQQQCLSDDTVIFNDLREGKPISKICSFAGKVLEEYDFHIGLVSKDKKKTAVYSYESLYVNEHEYGYAGINNIFGGQSLYQ